MNTSSVVESTIHCSQVGREEHVVTKVAFKLAARMAALKPSSPVALFSPGTDAQCSAVKPVQKESEAQNVLK